MYNRLQGITPASAASPCHLCPINHITNNTMSEDFNDNNDITPEDITNKADTTDTSTSYGMPPKSDYNPETMKDNITHHLSGM